MSRLRLSVIAVGASATGFVAAPAWAATVEVASRIASVTVYPDAASVTRMTEIDLPAGATSLVFRGLPIGLDPASLRVEGSAQAGLAIGSVEARNAPTSGKPADTGIEIKLKQLRFEREGWQSTLDALEAKKAMILRFGQSGPEKLSPESAPLDIGRWSSAWDAVGQGLAKVGDDLRAARGSLRDLDDQIAALEQARQRPNPRGGAARDVVVELDAAEATKGRLTLTYRVQGASWRPLYDVRLDTGKAGSKPTLELVRRASVTQRTGEDWSGVDLELSTVRTIRGTRAPDLQPLQMMFPEPPVIYSRPRTMAAPAPGAADLQRSEAMKAEAQPAPAAPFVPAQENEAVAVSGAYQASFRVPGKIEVPADGAAKTFRIGSRTLSPELSVHATPVLDATAFLSARFTQEDDAPLLPGQVSIQRDGIFVGQGRIGFVAPGDSAELGFGADDKVKVTRVPVRRKENEPTWLGSTKVETREFRTTVRNLHDFPVKVAIFDRVPISENSAIVIETLPATTPPTGKTVDDKRGVMSWRLDLAPGEARDIRLAYRMKWPADRDVDFVENPVRQR
ncbi:MAG: hypothetical protein JWL93_90 [Hyphomicrobiales bacterium]|nr:hypothetical protein [Hyphomicrobiales bacterium]